MKFHHEAGSKKVVLNGIDIVVPSGVKYVTINMNDVVQGWTDEPYVSEGRWYSHDCTPIRLGWVEFEFGDDHPWTPIEVL